MEEKQIKLYNNKVVNLMTSFIDGDCSIYAFSNGHKMVGQCIFSINKNSNDKFCNLIKIDVLSREYYKVGLGSAMFKEMENYAISQNCNKIRAFYFPSGQFPQGARKFYERNGFTFNFDIDKYDKLPPCKIVTKHTIATKELTKTNEKDKTL